MITYVYETIPPVTSEDEPKQFEVTQSISDPPLTVDPSSGYPVKRIITGGLGFGESKAGSECCGGGCRHE